MRKILITGASGNIGSPLIEYLYQYHAELEIVLASTNIEKCRAMFQHLPKLTYLYFDFADPTSYQDQYFDLVFLLRPPHLADCQKYFTPFIASLEKQKVQQLVFLSVQGAKSFVPHYKIEQIIKQSSLDYIFVRPSYFMQNLNTTLAKDIQKGTIFLPSKNAKFLWVDTRDVAFACAELIYHFAEYKNKTYDITGKDLLAFGEIKSSKFTFQNVNLFKFYLMQRAAGEKTAFILVKIMLHFLPRFEKAPQISDNFQKICKQEPRSLQAFLQEENLL